MEVENCLAPMRVGCSRTSRHPKRLVDLCESDVKVHDLQNRECGQTRGGLKTCFVFGDCLPSAPSSQSAVFWDGDLGLYYEGGEVVVSEGLHRKLDLKFQVLHLDRVDVHSQDLAGCSADLRAGLWFRELSRSQTAYGV